MIKRISIITVVVKDQEEALKWYTEKLGFEKRMEQKMGKDFRWLSVGLPEQKHVEITLANWKWYGDRNQDQIGTNAVVVLETSNCKEDYETLKGKGVKFTFAPEDAPYGVSLFSSIYMATRITSSNAKPILEKQILGATLSPKSHRGRGYSNSERSFSACLIMYCNTNTVTSLW